jgi:hypothetical protein
VKHWGTFRTLSVFFRQDWKRFQSEKQVLSRSHPGFSFPRMRRKGGSCFPGESAFPANLRKNPK